MYFWGKYFGISRMNIMGKDEEQKKMHNMGRKVAINH